MNNFQLTRRVKTFLSVVIVFLVCLLFSRQIAMQNATRGCSTFRLVEDEEPSIIQVQWNMYGDVSELHGNEETKNLWLPVWVVILNGKWHLSGGPAPELGQPESETQYFDQCTAIVNALTGHAYQIQAKPISVSK